MDDEKGPFDPPSTNSSSLKTVSSNSVFGEAVGNATPVFPLVSDSFLCNVSERARERGRTTKRDDSEEDFVRNSKVTITTKRVPLPRLPNSRASSRGSASSAPANIGSKSSPRVITKKQFSKEKAHKTGLSALSLHSRDESKDAEMRQINDFVEEDTIARMTLDTGDTGTKRNLEASFHDEADAAPSMDSSWAHPENSEEHGSSVGASWVRLPSNKSTASEHDELDNSGHDAVSVGRETIADSEQPEGFDVNDPTYQRLQDTILDSMLETHFGSDQQPPPSPKGNVEEGTGSSLTREQEDSNRAAFHAARDYARKYGHTPPQSMRGEPQAVGIITRVDANPTGSLTTISDSNPKQSLHLTEQSHSNEQAMRTGPRGGQERSPGTPSGGDGSHKRLISGPMPPHKCEPCERELRIIGACVVCHKACCKFCIGPRDLFLSAGKCWKCEGNFTGPQEHWGLANECSAAGEAPEAQPGSRSHSSEGYMSASGAVEEPSVVEELRKECDKYKRMGQEYESETSHL